MTEASTRDVATIERARADQADALSVLAMRSKGYWGYDAAFLDACREDLAVTASEIERDIIYVMAEADRLLGYYRVRGRPPNGELVDLFVDPQAIGQGYGKRLLRHAVETAREHGFSSLTLQSDPHAEGFYLAMGAARIGVSVSTVLPDRLLPLMRFDLTSSNAEHGADEES